MPTEADPIVGSWYTHRDKGQSFEVVAIDEDSGLIEIQFFDGDLDEIALDEWYELEIEPSEAPEDWSGPVDLGEQDDYGESVTDTRPSDWSEPLHPRQPQGGRPKAGETQGDEGED